MKVVIYKDFGGLKATTEENYYSRIQNARKIVNLSAFNNFEGAKACMLKCGWGAAEFIDLTRPAA